MPGQLTLPDGRILGFAVYGDPQGYPVLACHGVPGTRLMFRPADAIARSLGLRVIAIDRPGYGRSTPAAGRTLSTWVPDAMALVSSLALGRVALFAISGGAPFAVASAAAFGDRATALGLAGPMGPVHDVQGDVALALSERLLFLSAARSRWLVTAAAGLGQAIFQRMALASYDVFLKTLPPADRAILQAPKVKCQIIADVFESLTYNGAGFRADLQIFSAPWDVDYTRIKARSMLWQGSVDSIVPVAAALRLGELLPRCEVHVVPDAGHFWIYGNWQTALGALRAAIDAEM